MVELTDNHCRITATKFPSKFPSDRYCTIYYLFFKVTFKRRLTAYVFRDKVSRSGSNICLSKSSWFIRKAFDDGWFLVFIPFLFHWPIEDECRRHAPLNYMI